MPDEMVKDIRAVDIETRSLLEELVRRLGIASGKVKLELIFVDGHLEDGYRHHRLEPRDLGECLCRRHAWSPSCPVHPPVERELAQRTS